MADKPLYDKYGNVIGWSTEDGRSLDKYGNTTGYTTSEGRTLDKYGNTTGYVTSDGRLQDKYGNTTGYVTADGRVQDKYGNTISTDSGSGSGSGLEGLVGLLVLFLFVIGVGFAITPIFAPIFRIRSANAQKRGDATGAKKWQNWGQVTAILAVLFAFAIAYLVWWFPIELIKMSSPGKGGEVIFTLVVYAIVAVGLVSTAILSSVVIMAPTGIVYLRQKESEYQDAGNTTRATRARRLAWAWGISATGILGLGAFSVWHAPC